MPLNGADDSIDPDQEQSDLGLECSLRPVCPNYFLTLLHSERTKLLAVLAILSAIGFK